MLEKDGVSMKMETYHFQWYGEMVNLPVTRCSCQGGDFHEFFYPDQKC